MTQNPIILPPLCPLLQGVTTALAMTQGLGSPVFAACTAFTLVVMYDAMGVRRHAGETHSWVMEGSGSEGKRGGASEIMHNAVGGFTR